MTVRGDESLPPEAVRAELERIVASPEFADSPRVAAFLTYVVEARLAGEDDRIQEYGIGLAVFERPQSFDPRIDSIVRVEARRLRDKLARYYETTEAAGPVRIELPRRGYTPRFVGAEKDALEQKPPPPPPAPSRLPWWIAGLAAMALLVWWLVPRTSAPDSPSEPVAFTLPPPDGMHHVPVYLGGGAVVSPDGHWIAFVAGVAGGEQALFLRPIAHPEARRIEGSSSARWPFWSPDSRHVGFGADDEIKTVGIDGAPVVTVGKAELYFGGGWGGAHGDVIVFGERRAGLHRLPASGGTAEPLTTLAEGERGHGWPEFLPGGERLLFVSRNNDRRGVDLRLASLSDSTARSVAEADSQAIYAERSGKERLLFVRDDTLFEQDFDLGSATLSGPPLPIQDKISSSSVRFGKYDFSAARSGVLSFRSREGVFGVSELVWHDRNGRRLSQAASPDRYYYMSLSPSGDVVAATLTDDSENVDVWTIDLLRGVRQRRTRHAGLDRTPIWSPDGAAILFNSERAEVQSDSKMYVVPREGGTVQHFPVRAPGLPEGGWPSDWKHGRVVFTRNRNLYWARPGRPAEPLLEEDLRSINGRLSPTDELIAFRSTESGESEVWLAPTSDMARRIQVSNAGGNYPLWRGDGRELFYVAPDGLLMSVEVDPDGDPLASRPRELFQMNLPFSAASTIYRYAVAADGQRFLCQNLLDRPAPVVIVDR